MTAMKLTGAKLAAFLNKPDPAVRAALLFGSDEGLVRERAFGLITKIAEDPADPFRVVDLDAAEIRAEPARLTDEAAAIAMTGGRRAIRVRGASDGLAKATEAALKVPADSLMIFEAGELPPRSALRKLFEKEKSAVAIGCYGDSGQALEQVIRQTLAQFEVEAEADAIAYLCDRLGADRMMTRLEVEKLALFAGRGGAVGLADAVACVGDNAGLSLDDALFAAGGGDTAALERALDEAMAGGAAPISVLRGAMRHFQRLQLALVHKDAGASDSEAMSQLRPPVFFRVADRFRVEMQRWSLTRTSKALEALVDAEESCKSAGAPVQEICRDVLLRLGRAAAQAGHRVR